jgi:hypothetical protein
VTAPYIQPCCLNSIRLPASTLKPAHFSHLQTCRASSVSLKSVTTAHKVLVTFKIRPFPVGNENGWPFPVGYENGYSTCQSPSVSSPSLAFKNSKEPVSELSFSLLLPPSKHHHRCRQGGGGTFTTGNEDVDRLALNWLLKGLTMSWPVSQEPRGHCLTAIPTRCLRGSAGCFGCCGQLQCTFNCR